MPPRKKPSPQLSLLESMRPVPGYDNLLATSEGQLVNRRGQVRSLCDDQRGYLQLCVKRTSDGKFVTMKAHILIALAFHGPCPQPGHLVRHKNGVRHDIRPDNLEWGSQLENMADRAKHGTTVRKLTADDVKAIRRAEGSDRAIAARFGIHHSTVQRARRGHYWDGAPTPPPWVPGALEDEEGLPAGIGRMQGRGAS